MQTLEVVTESPVNHNKPLYRRFDFNSFANTGWVYGYEEVLTAPLKYISFSLLEDYDVAPTLPQCLTYTLKEVPPHLIHCIIIDNNPLTFNKFEQQYPEYFI